MVCLYQRLVLIMKKNEFRNSFEFQESSNPAVPNLIVLKYPPNTKTKTCIPSESFFTSKYCSKLHKTWISRTPLNSYVSCGGRVPQAGNRYSNQCKWSHTLERVSIYLTLRFSGLQGWLSMSSDVKVKASQNVIRQTTTTTTTFKEKRLIW